jgi:phosphoribosylamine--glycine ligase
MRVLVVGSGAREHALAWKLAGESGVSDVVCAPGNAGIARVARCASVDLNSPEAIFTLADHERIDLTIVGPESPLARGVSDLFQSRGRLLFGPSRAAAQLEASKAFAKAFMARQGIPTARFRVCDEASVAVDLIRRAEFGFPVVIKADGLAAGKGVTVAPDREAAEAAIRGAMVERRFGDAGTRIVLEECVRGEEVSVFAICDGHRALSLPSAQDHKRVFDDDEGPNTGGMGAFAPSPLMTPALHERVRREIVEPVLAGLRAEGHEYRGVLYAGLMVTENGPQVIEFNVRFGDPEAQVVLPMLMDELAPMLHDAAAGQLGERPFRVTNEPHVGIVMASGGYPGSYETGVPIEGVEQAEAIPGVLVFHAGSSFDNGRLVTAGGRVLTVVGRGRDFSEAIERAYHGVACVSFRGSHFRTDIGRKGLRVQ